MPTGREPASGAAPAGGGAASVARALLRAVERLAGSSRFLTALRRDRLLAAATALLAAVALSPLVATPILPLADLHATTGSAALLPDVLLGRGLAARHYQIQWLPVPYWTTYLIIGAASWATNALVAAKVHVALVVLLLPLATMRVLIALRRDPRLGLWAFALAWDHNLYAGWIAYLLGMGLALWAVAWLVECETPREAARIAVLALLIGLTHVQAAAYLGCAAVALAVCGKLSPRRLLLHVLAASGLLVVIVPWVIARVRAAGGAAAAAGLTFEWHTLGDKARDFFRFTLDNSPRPDDIRAAALAFAVLLLGPLVLGLLRQRALPPRAMSARLAPLALVLVPLALYAAMPMAVSGAAVYHWYTYPRYATFLLLALLFVPRPDVQSWRALALLPGVGAAVFLHVHVAGQFRDFATRITPFVEIIDRVPPDSAILPLQLHDADPATRIEPMNQIHAYVVGVKKGFDPHLWDNPSLPLLYRPEQKRPATWPVDGAGALFDLEQHGRFYDYVVVQGGLDRDPVAKKPESEHARARLVHEAGQFRLWAVTRR